MLLEVKNWTVIPGVKEIDHELAKFLSSRGGDFENSYPIYLMLSVYSSKQHSGCPLSDIVDKTLEELFDFDDPRNIPDWVNGFVPITNDFENILKCQKGVVGFDCDDFPVVYSTGPKILYLQRYYRYEQDIGNYITPKKNKTPLSENDIAGINRLFPKNKEGDSPNWQKVAAISACQHEFTVITGGPGTGKTTTVAKILALLLTRDPSAKVSILAPTGKAADRLSGSIKSALDDPEKTFPGIAESVLNAIPTSATTLHRYLKFRPGKGFAYGKRRKTSCDIVLIDETSMVSLQMFSSVLSALKPDCKVILLGDPQQLTAVDSGQVLSDLVSVNPDNEFSQLFCEDLDEKFGIKVSGSASHPMASQVVKLKHSYRFTASSGIGQLAKIINDANELPPNLGEVFGKFKAETREIAHLDASTFNEQCLEEALLGFKSYQKALESKDPKTILDSLEDFQILCSHNSGVFGVENVNRIISQGMFGVDESVDIDGKIIMITQNDHRLKLYNGDCGILLDNKAHFPSQQGPKSFPIAILPSRVSAYAMSIHKSQGSEYSNVLMILASKDSLHLTKELIYTGITRARKYVTLWHEPKITSKASLRKTSRTSAINYSL